MVKRGTVLLAGLLLAVTACGDDNGDTGGSADAPGNSPGTSAAAGANAPPQCVVGKWSATGVDAEGGFGKASGTISGGTGATMNVGADGMTEVGFSGSRPLDFSAEVAGATVRGQAQYNGTVRGSVQFGPEGSDNRGAWTPQGQITWDALKATVKLTEPISVTLLDNAEISDFTGDKATQAGGAVDVQPVLRSGTYTCNGDTLQVRTEQNGPTMEWTFTRA